MLCVTVTRHTAAFAAIPDFSYSLFQPMAQLNNLRGAYHTLSERVRIALKSQVGDVQRLQAQKTEVLSLLHASEQVSRDNRLI